MYRVELSSFAKKQLKKLDKHTQRILLSWIEKNLSGCLDPKQKGKPLTANRKNQWRYRVGDYRIVVEIFEDKILILVVGLGHRKGIYEQSPE